MLALRLVAGIYEPLHVGTETLQPVAHVGRHVGKVQRTAAAVGQHLAHAVVAADDDIAVTTIVDGIHQRIALTVGLEGLYTHLGGSTTGCSTLGEIVCCYLQRLLAADGFTHGKHTHKQA